MPLLRLFSLRTARLFRPLAACALLACSLTTRAAPANITDGELALLPPYCQDVQAIRYGGENSGSSSPRAPHWVAVLGKPFWGLHHYCWGLVHLRRSTAPGTTPQSRQGMIRDAISDYQFVIKNSPRDFALAPEILLRIGEAHLLLGQSSQANESLQLARQIKPDYWPAYTRWIDVLIKTNQKPAAKELALIGLQHAPRSQALIDRYRQLGGDPSTVELVKVRAEPASTDGTEQPSGGASTASAPIRADRPADPASAPQ